MVMVCSTVKGATWIIMASVLCLDLHSVPSCFWQRRPPGCLEMSRTRAVKTEPLCGRYNGQGRWALAETDPHYFCCKWMTLLFSNLSRINFCLMAITLFVRNENKFWGTQITTCVTRLTLLTHTAEHPTGAPHFADTWKGAEKKKKEPWAEGRCATLSSDRLQVWSFLLHH